ncbi:hypothetical protein L202_07002 [Cryptococcus amylolentus CBS 6039]|uniref:DDE Tnp4 domain-containing protein n=1 Tax=Cryptococcus amylolentus CBS 6039 TaxID=1295533 RepID=A0A1E3HE87_9TREE|nr:hypothetical protein L202_07002 [Cryptococcus amylolentus CBS 6039]ODN74662.1 hypothetical protein L202_07002 [Cryptococcus amylolentus CBS 6039]
MPEPCKKPVLQAYYKERVLCYRRLALLGPNCFMPVFLKTLEMKDALYRKHWLATCQYKPRAYLNDALFNNMSDKDLKAFIRVDHREFNGIIEEFGDHQMLHSWGTKRAATPKMQIGLALRCLATGSSLEALSRQFKLSSKWYCDPYTKHACTAIASKRDKFIVWPDAFECSAIQKAVLGKYGLPGCVGYIDGVSINFYQTPNRGRANNASLWSYKKNYCLNIVVT